MTRYRSIADAVVGEAVARVGHRTEPIVTSDSGVGARLAAQGLTVLDGPLEDHPDETVGSVLLTADDLSIAGSHAEGLLHHAARVLVPEGLLAVTARNAGFATATGAPVAGRAYRAGDLDRLIGHFGFTTDLVCAPGASDRLRTTVDPDAADREDVVDIDADRDPGLLHAGPALLAFAARARDREDRSRRFFATLPRKVIAASTLCRADDGRMLVVHDAFKQHWTIPGGVVDADENPRDGAERESWEETGIRIAVGVLLGVFAGSHPDRLVLVYDGVPVGGGSPAPDPVHPHEIDDAAWLAVPEALDLLAPCIAFQVRRCLSEPGGTWTQSQA